MTASERATAGSVRSAHVAHFLPPDWSRVARLAAPALERSARDASAPQLLIIVPDAVAAVALARALDALKAAKDRRIVAATSPARAKRLLAAGPTQAVIGPCSALAPALAASALKLDQLGTIIFAAADELDADDADLAAILAEVPKGASRLLTALEATPSVEALIERQMHKARRVTEDVAPAASDAPALANVRYLAVAGAPADALAQVLDEVDAPTTTVIAADEATADAARAVLHALGHADDALARVSDGEVAANTALVVVLGVPTGSAWAQVVAATPAQVVAIIAPRQRAALQRLAGATPVAPFAARAAVLKARAAEARQRAELRDVLVNGIPSREVLALEPLLAEYDGLEIAAAALRLLDRTRAQTDELVKAAEARLRAAMKEAQQAEAAESREPRERPIRIDRRDLPRTFGDDRPRKPRPFTPRGDGPRGEGPRGDKPRGPRRDDAFPLREPGERPRGFAPRGGKPGGKPGGFAPRGGKPGPRRDDDRGPRGPRGPR